MLWVAVSAVRAALPDSRIVICAPWPAGKNGGDAQIVADARQRVQQHFHMDVPEFVPVRVRSAWLTDPTRYPRLTLLFQALGVIVLGVEAYFACAADVFVDSANMAFALVPAKVLGATTVTYTHYPTISTDMLAVVQERKGQFNNDAKIVRSRLLSQMKLVYYRAFAWLYSLAGRATDVCMVNSTWTHNHMSAIWTHKAGKEIETVFPPCDTQLLSTLSTAANDRTRGLILSVGQFRPEKNHMLQLEVMDKLVNSGKYDLGSTRPKLVMVGGARHEGDVARVKALREERTRRGLESAVEMRVNAKWEELFKLQSMAEVGLHTMRDEHFGIVIVALQAAGVVPVAHRSGGVALDIIEDGESGYLADNADEYARQLHNVLSDACGAKTQKVRAYARERTRRFSDVEFAERFGAAIAHAAGYHSRSELRSQ